MDFDRLFYGFFDGGNVEVVGGREVLNFGLDLWMDVEVKYFINV